MKNPKDLISTLIAILLIIAEPINSWLISNAPFDWKIFASSLLMAAVAYLTGKNANLTKKTTVQVDEQTKLAGKSKDA